MGTVVALAGAIGSGKSVLSHRVSERLHWPRISFGDYVRKIAERNRRDAGDRSVLQQLGQALVVTNVEDFVDKVLAEANWRERGNLILDGLRHVEVRQVLIER